MRFGVVPVQPLQKRLMSTLVNRPVVAGVKVCPPQVVVVMPTPLLPSVVFCWSMRSGLRSSTSPGLTARSTFVATPVWKSACVVSVRHALVGAEPSEKSCVVVLPSVTTMGEAVLELYPGALAVALG